MPEQNLLVFATGKTGVPLRTLRDALVRAGLPASIGVEIAGDAIDAQLDDPKWESAWVRWRKPELHDVFLLTRNQIGTDEEADEALRAAVRAVAARGESGDKLLVLDTLGKTQVVYACEVLPALLDDADHPAWDALDVLLRALALAGAGLIYAEGEAFYDPDGEPMLVEGDEK